MELISTRKQLDCTKGKLAKEKKKENGRYIKIILKGNANLWFSNRPRPLTHRLRSISENMLTFLVFLDICNYTVMYIIHQALGFGQFYQVGGITEEG